MPRSEEDAYKHIRSIIRSQIGKKNPVYNFTIPKNFPDKEIPALKATLAVLIDHEERLLKQKNRKTLSMDAFTKGLAKGMDIDPLTAVGLALSGTNFGLNIADRIKGKIKERKTIKAQQQAINHLKKELKNSDLRSDLQSIPSKLLTPADKKLLAPTKLEKELGDYWMLEGVDNKGYLPYLKKIPKMAAKHKYPEVREAAKAFQNKYGNAQLLPTWFSGQMTMLPKDKAGYIKAHKNIFEQEFMANQRKAENRNAKRNKRK